MDVKIGQRILLSLKTVGKSGSPYFELSKEMICS
jgi:hypothetical protein